MNKEITGDLPGGLAQPALRALKGAGITTLEELSKFSEAEIKYLHGIGPNALTNLKSALSHRGLSFADSNHQKERLNVEKQKKEV
jgi:hypothetical protein